MILERIEIRCDDVHAEAETVQLLRDQLLRSLFVPGQAGGLHEPLQEGDEVAAQRLDSRDDPGDKIAHQAAARLVDRYVLFLEYALAYTGTAISLLQRRSATGGPAATCSGTTPAQVRKRQSPPSSIGGPCRTFAEHSVIGNRSANVAFSSRSFGCRDSAQRPGRMCSDNRRKASSFSAGSSTSVAVPSTTTER